MHTNAYVVSTGKKECILIDPGAEAQTIIQRLETMNLIPQAIIYTHGHIDHTSGSAGIIHHYAERSHHIKIGIHNRDAEFLGSRSVELNRDVFAPFGEQALSALEAFEQDVPDPEFFFNDGEAILDTDLFVIHTPGHSAGSTCFYSESRQALFSGDTLFFNTVGRGDVTGGDSAAILEAVQLRLFELPEETRVFPGHGPLTTIEREIKNNPLESDGATI